MNKMNRGDTLVQREIYKYAKLHNVNIVNSGCTLGERKLAESFLRSGAKSYIGSIDYVDGNAKTYVYNTLILRAY